MNTFPRRAILAGAIFTALGVSAAARANTINVDGTGCTLADAISSANTGSSVGACSSGSVGADEIDISTDVIMAAELPHIFTDIQFVGVGAAPPTISGNNAVRLFFVQGANVSFSNLTLTNAKVTGGSASMGGGAGAGLGAALMMYGGTVTVSNVTFSGNSGAGGSASGTTGISPINSFNMGYGGGGGGGMSGNGAIGGPFNGADAPNGSFGRGGGGGGTTDGEGGFNGGKGGDTYFGGLGGSGGFGGSSLVTAPAGLRGEFGPGGGGAGGGFSGHGNAQPGGDGGFGGGGGGGAGTCRNYSLCAPEDGTGGKGGFGGGGGAGGSNANLSGAAGGAGGFGGGGGAGGAGESGGSVGFGGFGGGDAGNGGGLGSGGGGGGAFGAAIFIQGGHLDVRNSTFDQNSVAGGPGSGNPGQGKGAAIFAVHLTTASNGNNSGLPATLQVVTGCNNTFTNSTATDAGTSSRDNADTFGVDRTILSLTDCNDSIFADGFGVP